MLTLPIKQIADAAAEYRNNSSFDLLIKACGTKRSLVKSRDLKDDIGSLTNLCQVAIE